MDKENSQEQKLNSNFLDLDKISMPYYTTNFPMNLEPKELSVICETFGKVVGIYITRNFLRLVKDLLWCSFLITVVDVSKIKPYKPYVTYPLYHPKSFINCTIMR